MVAGSEILESLRDLGVTVEIVGPDRIRLRPASKIPVELVSRIRESKAAILEVLRNRPLTCSRYCYEVEPGRWIHRPWTGCTTASPPAESIRMEEQACWHCRGTGECNCTACGHFETRAAWTSGACIPCEIRKHAPIQ